MNDVFERISRRFALKLSDPIFKILDVGGFHTLDAIKALRETEVVEELIKFYNANSVPTVAFKPGYRFLLHAIGSKAEELALEEEKDADLVVATVVEAEKFPLYNMITDQIGRRKYSEELKDAGLYLRLHLGPVPYSFLSANLPLPETSTLDRELKVAWSTLVYFRFSCIFSASNKDFCWKLFCQTQLLASISPKTHY